MNDNVVVFTWSTTLMNDQLQTVLRLLTFEWTKRTKMEGNNLQIRYITKLQAPRISSECTHVFCSAVFWTLKD